MQAGAEDQGQARRTIGGLLASQMFAVLSTVSAGGPYCSLVAFHASKNLTHVVFPTLRSTRKFGSLVDDPRVALLFDDRSNSQADVEQAVAVTATGRAAEITDGQELSVATRGFLARHPQLASFLASPECALVRVDIDTFYAVSEFQNVSRLQPAKDSGPSSPETYT